MRTDELDYELPPELIAQAPAEPRDAARLLVYRGGRGTIDGAIDDRTFADLPEILRPGDVLVRNQTRVLRARTHFVRETGGRLEVLFLEGAEDAPTAAARRWLVLIRGRPRAGEILTHIERREEVAQGSARQGIAPESRGGRNGWQLIVEQGLGDGRWLVRSTSPEPVVALLARYGETPLPPYIKARLVDPERYQTIFAVREGSAAAPTAGLHFTRDLDERLRARGVQVEALTLHVGVGTFRPITTDDVALHDLHSEPYEVDLATWRRILAAQREGRRVIAVGTTMTRLLETLARFDTPTAKGAVTTSTILRGRTDLYITPGFRFRLVDGLITNFHLPRTSLLALVMAFCGVEETRRIYAHAVAHRYRFYSFGDAMVAL